MPGADPGGRSNRRAAHSAADRHADSLHTQAKLWSQVTGHRVKQGRALRADTISYLLVLARALLVLHELNLQGVGAAKLNIP